MTAMADAIRPARRSAFREFLAGVGTIMVKELRSRMRGRRAFIVLTIYLACWRSSPTAPTSSSPRRPATTSVAAAS